MEDKIEKRRLLKSLHSSGYKVRSHKNADGSWTVSPIGAMRATRRRPVVGGFRPRYRAQQQGRYVPIGRMQKYHRRYGPAPRPRVYPVGYAVSYRPRTGTSFQRFGQWQANRIAKRQQENIERVQAKKDAEITQKKMLDERLSHEKAENMKVVRHAEFNAAREQVKQERETKVDQAALQEAREKEVT